MKTIKNTERKEPMKKEKTYKEAFDELHIKYKEEAIRLAIRKTAEMFEPIDTSKHSERAKLVIKEIEKCDWGCRSENVRSLMSAVLGEDLGAKGSGLSFVTGAVCVASKNPNSHDYGTNPFLVGPNRSSGSACTSSGLRGESKGLGNNIHSSGSSSADLRAATDKEIRDFFKDLDAHGFRIASDYLFS